MIELWPRFWDNGQSVQDPKAKESGPSQWQLSGFLFDMKKGPRSEVLSSRSSFYFSQQQQNKIVLVFNVSIYVNYFRLKEIYLLADMRHKTK